MEQILIKIKKFRLIFYLIVSLFFIFFTRNQLHSISNFSVSTYKAFLTKQDLKKIKQHLMAAKLNEKKFPEESHFINWYRDNLKAELRFRFPLDRWGEPLKYKTLHNRDMFTLTSSGKDKKFNTKDDIIFKSPIE